MSVPQRISLVTLGVADVVASTALYERLGWRRSSASMEGDVTFIDTPGGILGLWAYINFDWIAGLVWFLGKTFGLVFLFVWMRGTLPRVRVDQLMGFAWKWLLPASLLNLFVTAAAVLVIDSL